MKKIRNQINGVLLLDKPLGLSSNQAIQKVKWLLNAEKAGHTGTLDPLATGLLPVCLGEATKFAAYLLDGDKEYLATAQLGVVTESGDSEGKIIAESAADVNPEQLFAVCERFCGQIEQIPPMFSALKHNGRPLYEYARAGIEIERERRLVTIHQLEVTDFNARLQQFSFRARVSKGTYIRTLAVDIGAALGCGASLLSLRRTQTNQFNLSESLNLEELSAAHVAGTLPLLPSDMLVSDLPAYSLEPSEFAVIRFGNVLVLAEPLPYHLSGDELRLYAADYFLGTAIYEITAERCLLRPKRLLNNLASLQPWQ